MASKSQTKYMVAMALVIGVSEIMEREYRTRNGCERIRGMIAALHIKANEALLKSHGSLIEKEIAEIKHKIGEMEESGLESAKSYQTYLSMLIGIVTDRIIELPGTSDKAKPLNEVLFILENIHRYFEQRTRSEHFDTSGCEMLGKFDELFNSENSGMRISI